MPKPSSNSRGSNAPGRCGDELEVAAQVVAQAVALGAVDRLVPGESTRAAAASAPSSSSSASGRLAASSRALPVCSRRPAKTAASTSCATAAAGHRHRVGRELARPQAALDEPLDRAGGPGLERRGGVRVVPAQRQQRGGRRQRRDHRPAFAAGRGRAPRARRRRRRGRRRLLPARACRRRERARRASSALAEAVGEVVDEQRPQRRLAVVGRVVPADAQPARRPRAQRVEEVALRGERLEPPRRARAPRPARARRARRSRGTAARAPARETRPPAGRR